MKKQIVTVLAALLLSGCGAEEIFETMSDEFVQPVMVEVREVSLFLPPEAASPTLENEDGAVYVCGDYEICRQDVSAGDLSATLRSITGYEPEELTVIKTLRDSWKRYDFVWTSASEEGDRVGQGCVLDDGNYHYVLTILGNADTAREHQSVWQEVLDSFALN